MSLIDADDVLIDELAGQVTYSGVTGTIAAVRQDDDLLSDGSGPMGADARYRPGQARYASFIVAKSAVANPAQGDEITDGGFVYRVRQIESGNGAGYWVLKCSTDDRRNRR